jgi:tRNA-dihydrouridine synthase B
MEPGLPVFKIQNIPIYGDLILSPMDGYSDLPFRSVCRELGSAMSYTEFINALDILQGHPFVHEKLEYLPSEQPVVYQIFDNDPKRLLEVALRLCERGPAAIDINLGCSSRNVSGRGAGAGLLRTPLKIARIFRSLSRALPVPVTAKMRLGWDEHSRNHCLVARIIEENGGSLIAVHGRTRQQGYKGLADWHAIGEVCRAVSVPVIANGDIRTVADIAHIKKLTGCAGVMIGRAAVGNPWLFSRLDRAQVPVEEVLRVIHRHLELSQTFYGTERGLIVFRKHARRYLSPYELPGALQEQLLTTGQAAEFLNLVERCVLAAPAPEDPAEHPSQG